ncbi:hypothetical protein EDB84DRAFT_1600508 [Lactarius hengduanensis]|nr:hypothetical protein EDB84DRAFT_1600508 [Lactarius hengduanensis]
MWQLGRTAHHRAEAVGRAAVLPNLEPEPWAIKSWAGGVPGFGRHPALEPGRQITRHILRRIRNVYITLHQGYRRCPGPKHDSTPLTISTQFCPEPSSYPLCNVTSHHPDSTPHIHEVHCPPQPLLTLPCVITLRWSLLPLSSTPYTPSSSVPVPLPVDGNVTCVPLLASGDHTPVLVSFHPAHPTTVEDHHILVTSSDQPPPNASRGGVDTFIRTMPYPTPETLLPPSSYLNFPTWLQLPISTTQTPALLRTCQISHLHLLFPFPKKSFQQTPPLSPDPPVTRSDHAHSLLESQSSMLATTPPGTPQPASVLPGLGAATEGGGNVKGILHKDKDALGPPSVNHHAKTMATEFAPVIS